MIDIEKLTQEYPEIVIVEKKKINGVNYRYVLQFINKPNIIMIDKESILYSGLNTDFTQLLNHGDYNNTKLYKLITDIIGKLADHTTVINDAVIFIKQGINILYKDSVILKPYTHHELLAKLEIPAENQELIKHLADSYTIITDLLSYIRRKDNPDSMPSTDIRIASFNKEAIKSLSDDIEDFNNKQKIETEHKNIAIRTRLLRRLGLKAVTNVNNYNKEPYRRTTGYHHHHNLLCRAGQSSYIYNETAYFKQLANLGIQFKDGNFYYLKDVELIPYDEYVFDVADYLE